MLTLATGHVGCQVYYDATYASASRGGRSADSITGPSRRRLLGQTTEDRLFELVDKAREPAE